MQRSQLEIIEVMMYMAVCIDYVNVFVYVCVCVYSYDHGS